MAGLPLVRYLAFRFMGTHVTPCAHFFACTHSAFSDGVAQVGIPVPVRCVLRDVLFILMRR